MSYFLKKVVFNISLKSFNNEFDMTNFDKQSILKQTKRISLFAVLLLASFLVLLSVNIITSTWLHGNQLIPQPRLDSKLRSTKKYRLEFDPEDPIAEWPTPMEIVDSLNKNQEKYKPHELEKIVNEYVEKSRNFTIKPNITLLPRWKNPCWKQGEQTRCLPAFYIAGFPKCATTDLWENLVKHPKVVTPCTKECNWWANTRYLPTLKSFDNYIDCYEQLGKKKDPLSIIGDGSPDAAWLTYWMTLRAVVEEEIIKPRPITKDAILDNQVLPLYLMHRYTPNAKFLMIMRNPTDRLYSAYNYMRHNLNQFEKEAEEKDKMQFQVDKPTAADFHKSLVDRLRVYRQCLTRSDGDVRACSYHKDVFEGNNQIHFGAGLFIVYIRDLLRLIPRNQFMFINFHHYVKNRTQILEKVCKFLGLDPNPAFLHSLEKNQVANVHKVKDEPMWNKTKRILDDLHRPFNMALADYLKDPSYLFEDNK